jgi:hypothetical protein
MSEEFVNLDNEIVQKYVRIVTTGSLHTLITENNVKDVLNETMENLKEACIEKYNDFKAVPPLFVLISKNGNKTLILQPNFTSLETKTYALAIVKSLIENNAVQVVFFVTEAFWKQVKTEEEAKRTHTLANDDDASEAVVFSMATKEEITTKMLLIKRVDGSIATEFSNENTASNATNKNNGRLNKIFAAINTSIKE